MGRVERATLEFALRPQGHIQFATCFCKYLLAHSHTHSFTWGLLCGAAFLLQEPLSHSNIGPVVHKT